MGFCFLQNFLKLDCSNGPLTGDLEVEGDFSAAPASVYAMSNSPLQNNGHDYDGIPGIFPDTAFLYSNDDLQDLGGSPNTSVIDGDTDIDVMLVDATAVVPGAYVTIYYMNGDRAAVIAWMNSALGGAQVIDVEDTSVFSANGAGNAYTWNEPAGGDWQGIVSGYTDPATCAIGAGIPLIVTDQDNNTVTFAYGLTAGADVTISGTVYAAEYDGNGPGAGSLSLASAIPGHPVSVGGGSLYVAEGGITLANGGISTTGASSFSGQVLMGASGAVETVLRIYEEYTNPDVGALGGPPRAFSASTLVTENENTIDYGCSGMRGEAEFLGDQDGGGACIITGCSFEARWGSSGTLSGQLIANELYFGTSSGSGTAADATGLQLTTKVDGGNITGVARGVYCNPLTGDGSIATLVGFDFSDIDPDDYITTLYGIRIAAQTSAATTREIMLEGAGGIYFRDSDLSVLSNDDGRLDINADTAIDLNAAVFAASMKSGAGQGGAGAAAGELYVDTSDGNTVKRGV